MSGISLSTLLLRLSENRLMSLSHLGSEQGECRAQRNNYELTLSILGLIGIVVSYVPQHIRIIRKKSSDGFSPWFLLLGCLSTCWSFFNILILQWRGIRCCAVISAGLCMESTIGVAQLFVQFVLFTLIFVLYMIYFPPNKKVYSAVARLHLVCLPSRTLAWSISLLFAKIILGNFVVSAIMTIILLALVNDSGDRHSAWTMLWAGFLSVGSVLLAMIQYLPQIIETYFRKSVGALSIPMMMMHTPYAILIAVSLALNPEADWSTWFPYAFTAILQAVLLGMCLFYYIKAKRKGHSSFLAVETTPLLRVARENQGNESDPSAAHEDSARKQERTLRVDVDSELNIE